MEIGQKILEVRRLSGMTQEQMAEKLHVTRQTISKWEMDNSTPDLESMICFCRLFGLSMDELLMEKEEDAQHRREEGISLQDLVQINKRNRQTTILLLGGLFLFLIGVLSWIVVALVESTTESILYTLYRYIAVGQFTSVSVNYTRMMIPGAVMALAGTGLGIYCICAGRKGRKEK
jgi:DNA-binding XRE family transcriptional regulator